MRKIAKKPRTLYLRYNFDLGEKALAELFRAVINKYVYNVKLYDDRDPSGYVVRALSRDRASLEAAQAEIKERFNR